MIAARTNGGPAYPEMIGEMDRELNNIIENFDHAVLANEPYILNLSTVDPQGFGAERVEQEQELLFRRLMPVKTSYHRNLRCMDGTRQSLLNQITDWVSNGSGQENAPWRNMYWLCGLPGIGKTSLAHSICTSLHTRNHLAGAFSARGVTQI